jgi:hypothetical protein
MSRQLSDEDRRVFAQTLKQVGLHWQTILQDDEFHPLNFFDLFTEIWLMGEPASKTDCYRFMPGVSAQTAKKYVARAIARGHLLERANPQDGRSRLVALSPALTTLLEQNLDLTAQQLRQALKGPCDTAARAGRRRHEGS